MKQQENEMKNERPIGSTASESESVQESVKTRPDLESVGSAPLASFTASDSVQAFGTIPGSSREELAVGLGRPIFSIHGLICAYTPERPVLEIARIDIPLGRLVFVVGRSGVGKSTFIETLGLMNDTIAPHKDTSLLFRSDPEKVEAMELKDFWSQDNDRMSAFRAEHFSFVFQSTNLMDNFSAGENMMVNLLIDGVDGEEAKSQVLQVMDRLSLDRSLFDRSISELSGGQRQRLAFVRAITARFSVLFGDEPTGNLDEKTSGEVMTALKEILVSEGKTAIIVSHDLPMAMEFADMIIPITPRPGTEGESLSGEILDRHIMYRAENGWMRRTKEPILHPDSILRSLLD